MAYRNLIDKEGAYRIYPKEKKEEPISTIDDYQKEFLKSLEAYDTRQKKPVRWNFYTDNEGMFQLSQALDPYAKVNEGLVTLWNKATGREDELTATKLRKGFQKKINERDYIEGFDEIAKGIETGKHELNTSIGELLFMGTDMLTNKNFATKFQKMMDEQKPEEPETWRGDLASLMVQYGAPGAAIAKIANRAKFLQPVMNAIKKKFGNKASKIAQRMTTGATVVGATDALVSPDKRRVGTLLVKPEDTSKLEGRKKAAAMFRNRIRYGVEGTLVGGLFPLAGKSIQQTYKYAGRPLGEPFLKMGLNTLGSGFKGASYLFAKNPVLHSQVAKDLAKSSKYAIKKMITPMAKKIGGGRIDKAPPFEQWRLFSVTSPNKAERGLKRLDNILSWFRSYGKLPASIQGISESVELFIKSGARKVDKHLNSLEKRAYNLAKKYEQRHGTNNTSRPYEKMLKDDVVDYLQGTVKLGKVHKDLRPFAYEIKKDMNKVVTEFGKNLPRGTKNEVINDLRKALTGKLDKYLVRSFATFTNPKYTPLKAVKVDARNWIRDNVIQRNKDLREIALGTYGKQFPKSYLEKYADDLVENVLAKGRTAGVNPVAVLQEIGTKILRQDKYQFLKTGEELPGAIRKLLGQEKDLRSQVLFTVADANASNASLKGMDMIAQIGLKNGWLFRSPEQAMTKYTNPKQIGKIEQLGALKSELEDLFTSPELREVLTATGAPLDSFAKTGVIRQMLQFKVVVQAGKTLYSPQTQVRNVTSASFFALWNGHIGRNASVADSMRMMIRDIFRAGKGEPINEIEFNKYIAKLVRLGVYDENIVAQELRAVLKNIKEGVIKTDDDLFSTLVKNAGTEKVARLYAGGDNLWKGYGYEFFKSDFAAAFKNVDDVANYFKIHNRPFSRKDLMTGEVKSFDEALDEAAAFMLRNTYPTYSKVPPAIQGLRNIPFFGNFVSFPAEMLRTGTLSLAMSLKNIASGNPVLRQMGYRNLMGGYLAVKGIGQAGHATANFLTGNTQEQWEAYKRSSAAPWDQNSNLIGILPWKNGESAAINFSYFSPYDVLERPIQAAMTMAAKENIAPDQIENYALSLMFSPEGPIMELMSPFLSPAIGSERVLDVIGGDFLSGGRGGRTADGRYIYSPTDSLEDKFNKSLVHIFKGAEPGIVSSGRKIKDAIRGDVTGANKPSLLADEMLALFTGTRIIRIDVKKDLKWITADTNRLLRKVDETEKFYKARGFLDRPPSIMVNEFNKMQEEAFEIQRDLYMKIQDMRMLDLSKDKIEDILIDAKMNKTLVDNLIDGEFTPVKYSTPRFETKVETIKDAAKKRTEKSKNFIYNVNEGFVFPEDELDKVMDKWEDRKFFPKTYNPETKKLEGGYNPELEGAVTNDKGNIVYDESGKIKREPTILQRGFEKIKPLISPLTDQRSQTPLPATPEVNPQLAQASTKNITQTGLTRTENALLSNEEKAMRLQQRGQA